MAKNRGRAICADFWRGRLQRGVGENQEGTRGHEPIRQKEVGKETLIASGVASCTKDLNSIDAVKNRWYRTSFPAPMSLRNY